MVLNMLYVDFVSILTMLGTQMGYVFTVLDSTVMFTTPSSYNFTILDMLLGALISEELLAFVMEL